MASLYAGMDLAQELLSMNAWQDPLAAAGRKPRFSQLCLVPSCWCSAGGFLVSGATAELTSPISRANPIEYITHYTGDWTIRFLLITLSITPLRKIFNQPKLARFRRMLGLFAFFYGCLHLMTWFCWTNSSACPTCGPTS